MLRARLRNGRRRYHRGACGLTGDRVQRLPGRVGPVGQRALRGNSLSKLVTSAPNVHTSRRYRRRNICCASTTPLLALPPGRTRWRRRSDPAADSDVGVWHQGGRCRRDGGGMLAYVSLVPAAEENGSTPVAFGVAEVTPTPPRIVMDRPKVRPTRAVRRRGSPTSSPVLEVSSHQQVGRFRAKIC